jgi:hypothetical protein
LKISLKGGVGLGLATAKATVIAVGCLVGERNLIRVNRQPVASNYALRRQKGAGEIRRAFGTNRLPDAERQKERVPA